MWLCLASDMAENPRHHQRSVSWTFLGKASCQPNISSSTMAALSLLEYREPTASISTSKGMESMRGGRPISGTQRARLYRLDESRFECYESKRDIRTPHPEECSTLGSSPAFPIPQTATPVCFWETTSLLKEFQGRSSKKLPPAAHHPKNSKADCDRAVTCPRAKRL